MPPRQAKKRYGARTKTFDLSVYLDYPRPSLRDKWWRELAAKVRSYSSGQQRCWGIPFVMSGGPGPRAISAAQGRPETVIELNARADFLCFLHQWYQRPETVHTEDPGEGMDVAEYELAYSNGSRHVQPIRGRYEVSMAESPGPPWLAVPFHMPEALDPVKHCQDLSRGEMHRGTRNSQGEPLVYAMPNPHPERRIKALTIRGLQDSPLIISGLTLYQGSGHPLAHLPRRNYRVRTGSGPAKVAQAEVDLGGIARIEHTQGPRDRQWITSPYAGTTAAEPDRGEDLLQVYGAPDATVRVTLDGSRKPLEFSLGEAFHEGKSLSGEARLLVLGKRRQWMRVKVIDASTGKPTPARVHLSGSRGEYIAPYGHHSQVNTNWFEDYGADVSVGGRNYAYVPGEFTAELPVGDIYVEVCKGFEYEPVRRKLTVKARQELLEIEISRWKDLRREGWVTADTHVHFISPQTAWLEAQCEGVNVVNLLASQWGRLFTNVGDFTGRVGINEDDTIVYVGTENRNHVLGHISMLGTHGTPVYPMCCGGPHEGWVGDPEFLTLAECALENRRKGGLVPSCGSAQSMLYSWHVTPSYCC